MLTRLKRRMGEIGCYTYVTVLAVFAAFPLLWLFICSVKESGDLLANPTSMIPQKFTLANYHNVMVNLGLGTNIRNSLMVSLSTTLIATVISSLAAYGIVRFFPKLGNMMSKLLIMTYMFPAIVLVIPYAVVMGKLGLTNTRLGLVLVYLSFNVPYAVWLLVGFFKTVPIGIEEAARIDGAGRLQTFVRVVLPLVAPGLVSTAIYMFINAWNEFLYALILTSSSSITTLSIKLHTMQGADVLNWGDMMAACMVVVLPSVVFFSFIQKYIAGGMTEGAVK
ncbi:MAG: carbohydrate ABC transporter permease [Lachnospiraceae bacterium]|nr:carbohydrate ABC transporter permease [Lachnospiraceae bacterium]